MKCRTTAKNQGQNKVLEFVLYALAYAMFDSGYEGQEVKRLCECVDYVADSMCADYVRFCDIRKALKEEYDFIINIH